MKQENINPVKLLFRWAGSDRNYLIASIACAFFSGLFTIGSYIGIFRLMDALLSGICTKEVIVDNAVLIAGTVIVRQVLLAFSGVLSHKGAYGALFRVRCMITEHLAKVPLGVLDEKRSGDIKTVLNEDIEKLELCLAHNIPELVTYLTGPVVIFIYLMTVNVPLALVSLIPLPIAVIIMCFVFKYMSGIMTRVNSSLTDFNSVIIEYISGMKLIKAYNMGSSSFKKFSGAIEEENDIWNEVSRKTAPPYAAFIIVLECGMLLMVSIGGWLFLKGAITASIFLLFAYVGSLYLLELLPLQQLSTEFSQSMNGMRKAKEILDLPVFESGTGGSDGAFPQKCSVDMINVSFSYDGKNDVLKNCHLHIEDGERLAIVGASGSGKSTIIQLISRFYDVGGGEILIGGKNVKDIDYEELLANVSIVFQNTFLTRDSVLENIRMGLDADLEQVREAARKAQIDDFIMSLPEKYDTKVGSFGSRFSGGEKQRIAIARAILKNSPILILDEATSAADPENQVEIDRAIANLCSGKTVILVAHRLGAVKLCHKVAVVENHTVTCCGAHEEVLKSNSYYRNAWEDYNRARDLTYSMKDAISEDMPENTNENTKGDGENEDK